MVTTALWMVAAGLPALAARLDAVLPTTDLTVGQTVELTVQLQDGSAQGLPDVPHGSGLRVDYQGQGQSVVSVNFQTTRIQRYTYQVTALAEGIHQLGPVTLRADGQELSADPVRVTVRPRSAEQQQAHALEATLSDNAPYVGEVVVYETRYRRTQDIRRGEFTEPDFEGFLPEKYTEPEQREYTVQDGGQVAQINQRWTALVASKAGEHTLPATLLTVQIPEERRRNRRFDPFFDGSPTRTERLASDPTPVTIRPLPTEGKPSDFTGLVGTFALDAQPSAREVRLGGSVTLTVTLQGSGSLAGFELPPLPDGSGFRAYDTPGTVQARLQEGNFKAMLPVERALVPERAGKLTIPPLQLTAFDPDQERYVTLQTQPIPITVLPGDAGGAVSSFGTGSLPDGQAVTALGDDILPAPTRGSTRSATLQSAWPWALALGLTPLVGFAGWSVLGRAPRTRRADPRATLKARLASLPADPTDRLAALEALFREAAALQLAVPAPSLDRKAIATLGDHASALAADLDAARYGGISVADIEPRVRAFVEAT